MIAIGTSGWSYDHWTPQLYPPGLPLASGWPVHRDFSTAN